MKYLIILYTKSIKFLYIMILIIYLSKKNCLQLNHVIEIYFVNKLINLKEINSIFLNKIKV